MVAVAVAERIQSLLESVSGPWLYVVVGVLTFAETGTLLFIVPGEIGLFIAGAAAGAGNLNLALMLTIAISAAVIGDVTGFTIGRRLGPRMRYSRLGAKLGDHNWERAQHLIQRRRGLVVFVGRWVGFLRAIMPATAGMSGMSYRAFLPWDIAGAVTWASVCVVGGYILGDNWQELADSLGYVGIAAAVALVGGYLGYRIYRRVSRGGERPERRTGERRVATEASDAPTDGGHGADVEPSGELG